MTEQKNRLPPGQHKTDRFPVLQHGSILRLDRSKYKLKIEGLVEKPVEYSLDELKGLVKHVETIDIHCVTSWSKFDTKWAGVPFKDLMNIVEPKHETKFVIMYCADGGFTTSLPFQVMMDDDVLVAYEYEGKPISDDHGGPVRIIVPKRYFYKSAKWLVRLKLVEEDELGYWERGGYSNSADPWKEERYS